MPWILNEDAAIKAKLSGIQASSAAGPATVPARFTTPEPENTSMTYPVIVLTRTAVTRASDRERRGFTDFRYIQEGRPMPGPDDRWGYYGDRPIPYNIDYQVSVLTRLQAQQSELMARLARGDLLPERGGYIHIEPMGVIASLDLLGGPELSSQVDSHGKRLFSVNYVVRVFTEFSPYEVKRFEAVEKVTGKINDFDYQSDRDGAVVGSFTAPEV
ncbi:MULTISPECIES: hypothetical protein [Streptosporangium]|uniref:Uncharacterized protein n=1 Tax=Streptosporangium brasiliense TaxID=47480 RepID=A0ABT9RPP4_9ACTN|nr:hypothetical protein [Streptosporangium brasiliense]MDP9870325.1 hypothetical protein [Streptosporangium brasiliense]